MTAPRSLASALLGLALAGLPCPGGAQELAFVVSDPFGLLPGSLAELERELSAVLQPHGLAARLEWGDPEVARRGDEVHLVLLERPPRPLRRGRLILGATWREEATTCAVWVFVADLERALGMERPGGLPPSPSERRRLQRALARVVLHELVHVLDPGSTHSRSGLMAEAPGLAELLAEVPRLDGRALEVLGSAARRSRGGGPEPRPDALANR